MRTIYMQDQLYPDAQPQALDVTAVANLDGLMLTFFQGGYAPTAQGLTRDEYERLQALWIAFELTETRLRSAADLDPS